MNQQQRVQAPAALWGPDGCDTTIAGAALPSQAHNYHYDYQSNHNTANCDDEAVQNTYVGNEYVGFASSSVSVPAMTVPSPLADAFPEPPWPDATSPAFNYDPILYQQQQHDQHATVPSPGQISSSYSSYSSAHHNSEDDDETDVTLLLNADGEDGDDSSKKKQSALQRRRRNRESMRRSRMKEKEVLTTLRATLSQLESRFKQLTQWGESQLATSDPQRVQHCRLLQTKLSHVVQLKRELEAEKGAVQQFLDDKRASVLELQRVLAQWQLEDSDGGDARRTAEKLEILEAQARKCSGSASSSRVIAAISGGENRSFEFGFTALSATQINGLLTQFCSDLQRVKELARVTPPHDDVAHPVLEVFGWQTHRHIDAQSQMHFEFTKQFPHVDTLEVVERVWSDAVDLQQYKKDCKENERIRRMEFLQRVNERLGIVVREIKHPEENTIFRTHYALFMLETPEGFLFGIQSINPTAEQQEQLELERQQEMQQRSEAFGDGESPDADSSALNEKVVWVDVSISIEIQRRTLPMPPSGVLGQTNCFSGNQASEANAREDYCEVRWRGKTNYKTAKHAAENAVSFLLGILKWENDVIGPRFHLTAS